MANILIVEDSPTDAHAMKTALEGDAHQITLAEDATAGLEMAKQQKPDLIIMDVVFQGMSGFQGTRKLARDPDTSHIPVIMISSKDQESDKAWGLRQGASEYMVKPVASPQLLESVNKLLASGRGVSA